MRLRPSGRQGPVATSLDSFRAYQMGEAWTWEHLALTRARVLAGDAGLAGEVEALRRDVLVTKGAGAAVVRDVAGMRARLATAQQTSGALEAKAGPGRMMDVELMAQMLALQAGSAVRGVEGQLAAGVRHGKVSQTEATVLQATYTLCWQLQSALRLVTGKGTAAAGTGAMAFVLRETGEADMAALVARLIALTAAANAVISARLGP